MQAALSGPGWPSAHREVDHDILGRLLGTPPDTPAGDRPERTGTTAEAQNGAAHAPTPR